MGTLAGFFQILGYLLAIVLVLVVIHLIAKKLSDLIFSIIFNKPPLAIILLLIYYYIVYSLQQESDPWYLLIDTFILGTVALLFGIGVICWLGDTTPKRLKR